VEVCEEILAKRFCHQRLTEPALQFEVIQRHLELNIQKLKEVMLLNQRWSQEFFLVHFIIMVGFGKNAKKALARI